MIKKLLIAAIMLPTMAQADTCKAVYKGMYDIMSFRQSGIPMHVMMDHADESRKKYPDADQGYKFVVEAIELAYTMPYVGFFSDATHQMATEFANHQYRKCIRLRKK